MKSFLFRFKLEQWVGVQLAEPLGSFEEVLGLKDHLQYNKNAVFLH